MMKAIKERWKIPEGMRDELIEQMRRIAAGEIPDCKPRDRIRAAEALLAADQLNLDQEKIEQPAAPVIHEHRFSETLTIEQRTEAIIAALSQEQPDPGIIGANRSLIGPATIPVRPLPIEAHPEAGDVS